jgi:hypothetical protein
MIHITPIVIVRKADADLFTCAFTLASRTGPGLAAREVGR